MNGPLDDPQFEVLTRVPTESEASIISNELQNRGVEARAEGGFTSGFKAEAPGEVAIIVPADQLSKARQLLQTIRQEFREIDWSQIDVGEPEDE